MHVKYFTLNIELPLLSHLKCIYAFFSLLCIIQHSQDNYAIPSPFILGENAHATFVLDKKYRINTRQNENNIKREI